MASLKKNLVPALLTVALSAFSIPCSRVEAAQSSLLKGQVSLTFDDGPTGIFNYGYPILKKYNLVGTIYPIVGQVQDKVPWYVTWDQLTTLQNAGWEIGSHTMTHAALSSLSPTEMEYELAESLLVLTEHGFRVKSLAFPFGDFDDGVLARVTKYYDSSRLAWPVWGDGFTTAPDRYLIEAREVSNTTTPATVKSWIDQAYSQKKWLVLLFHDIVPGTPSAYQYKSANLETIAQYIASKRIPATTISGGLDYAHGANLIQNGDAEKVDNTGWATNWNRSDSQHVSVVTADVPKVYSTGKQIQLTGGSDQYVLTPQSITLPSSSATYLFSMYADVQMQPDYASGVGIWLNEYSAQGAWISGQWLGGHWQSLVSVPSYLYKPTSTNVRSIDINIFTIPSTATLIWRADSFKLEQLQ